jgi:hypothetical protein
MFQMGTNICSHLLSGLTRALFSKVNGRVNILFVPPIPQQIQISVDQPYAGPAASRCGIIGTHSIENRMGWLGRHTSVEISRSNIHCYQQQSAPLPYLAYWPSKLLLLLPRYINVAWVTFFVPVQLSSNERVLTVCPHLVNLNLIYQ